MDEPCCLALPYLVVIGVVCWLINGSDCYPLNRRGKGVFIQWCERTILRQTRTTYTIYNNDGEIQINIVCIDRRGTELVIPHDGENTCGGECAGEWLAEAPPRRGEESYGVGVNLITRPFLWVPTEWLKILVFPVQSGGKFSCLPNSGLEYSCLANRVA